MVSLARLLCSAALVAGSVYAGVVPRASYPTPGACSGTCTNAHDSSIIVRSDGTYVRYSTGGKIAMHTAPALVGPWTYQGAAIPAGSSINLAGNDDLWAPDVSKIGSTYYLYYSVSSFGSQSSAIGVATSTDGLTWTDKGATGIASTSSKPYNAIDGNLFVSGSTVLMSFGSFWSDIYQAPMAATPTKLASGASSTQVLYQPSGSHAEEGSFLYANGGYYYMFYSAGQCCGLDTSRPASGQEYHIMVCRASSPTGPFTDQSGASCLSGGGTTVLPSHDWVYAPGGQGVMTDPTYGPVLYYHYIDTRIGYSDGDKRLGWNKLSFSSGWPVVVS